MEYLLEPPGKGGCGYRPGRVATGGPARLATSWNSSASYQVSTWLLSAFTHRGLAKEGSASIAGADGRDFDGLLLDVCRSTALFGLGRHPDCVDERRECRGYLAPPRVIEKEAGKRRAPILEHSRERPSLEQGRNLVLDHVREAHTGQRGVDDHVLVIEHERPVDAHLHFVVALLEFPLVDRARCRQSEVDAAVLAKVVRCCRCRMRREVLRSSDDGHTKGARHRDGDHVLLERLAKANAGIEPLRDDVRQSRIDE